MKNINYKQVEITGGYWKKKQELNKNVTIDAVYDRFSETGRIKAFKFEWKEGMPDKPHIFWDSDVAKWMEGAAYVLAKEHNDEIYQKVNELIEDIEKNQCEDGYFNIYFTVCEPDARFTNRWAHELYCAGHLAEAAVALYEGIGDSRLLKCMEKYMAYIKKVFMEEKSASFDTPGHEEIELALIRMYNCTKDKKYLDLAMYFINTRGTSEKDLNDIVNSPEDKTADTGLSTQTHLPVREQKTAEGHSVRACYLYTAVAEAAALTGDKELFESCKSIFDDIITKKMYITGGIGSTNFYEGFTTPYDLPNKRAYAETCASIGMIYFAQKMMISENKTIYADIIEKQLYNGMISGLSLDGKSFFYTNPLGINLAVNNRFPGHTTNSKEWNPITQRPPVFGCSCCPPNINRLLASIGEYIYGYEDDEIYVNQFVISTAEINGMKISQQTNYPADGRIIIKSESAKAVHIRIPSWCNEFEIDCDYSVKDGYAVVENAECINVNFIMKPVFMEANTGVHNNVGKVAVMYGPVVYCAESCDNTKNLEELFICNDFKAEASFDEYFDANILSVKGVRKISCKELYAPVSDNYEDYTIKMIPYAAFANRGESNMCVWMKTI